MHTSGNESRSDAKTEDLLAMFGGKSQPVMAHLVEASKLSLEEVKEAERALRRQIKG